MKSCTRRRGLLLFAAAIAAVASAAAIGSAEGSGWLPSPLVSRPTGGSVPPPTLYAIPAGSAPAPGADEPMRLAVERQLRDGSFLGPAINTHWGPVQVRVNIRDGRVASVDVPVYPNDRRASVRINRGALPLLESEVIQAQSARVDMVSGATLTSEAYLRSVDAALRSAGALASRIGT